MGLSIRGVWGSPAISGVTRDSISAYLDRLQEAGINAIYMHLKGGDDLLYWPSKRFPQAVAPGHAEIDYPAMLLEECRKRNMRCEAWLIDFFAGGAAYREHPEWAMTNGRGKPTTSEVLRGSQFTGLWMCPARRPGYTDQWLVPVLREFAEMYDFDGIHHDYIRYPGDLAPDQYCFCDYCLEEMARFNGFISKTYANEPFYHELYDREYLEAHWEQSPRVLPMNWNSLDRNSKARFYLEGSFFQGGRNDLDYFFYTYRTYWITRFAREAAETVRAARPTMEISAAVFKNPVHSGRFIGQDWRQFAPYVDAAIPMDYRDHFPGTFEQYLGLLGETIQRQKTWATDFKRLQIGVAVNFLFKEEENGPYPQEKLECVLEVVKSGGVDGFVIFCDEQIERYGMWSALKAALS